MPAALLRLVGVMCAAVVAGSAELLREDATGTPARGGVIVGVGILSRSDHAAQRRCSAIHLDEQTNAVHRRKHTRAHTGGSRCIVPQICTHAHTHTVASQICTHTRTLLLVLCHKPPPPSLPLPPHLLRREKGRRDGQRYIWTDATRTVFVRNRDKRACARAHTKCRASR